MIAGYSDKSPSVFENTENEPTMENPNFPLIVTCVVLVIMFVAVGTINCCCRNVIKERYSKKISPEKEIQTKPENDSSLAQTDFDLPPAYTAMFTYS